MRRVEHPWPINRSQTSRLVEVRLPRIWHFWHLTCPRMSRLYWRMWRIAHVHWPCGLVIATWASR